MMSNKKTNISKDIRTQLECSIDNSWANKSIAPINRYQEVSELTPTSSSDDGAVQRIQLDIATSQNQLCQINVDIPPAEQQLDDDEQRVVNIKAHQHNEDPRADDNRIIKTRDFSTSIHDLMKEFDALQQTVRSQEVVILQYRQKEAAFKEKSLRQEWLYIQLDQLTMENAQLQYEIGRLKLQIDRTAVA
jgi:hypothetical protein